MSTRRALLPPILVGVALGVLSAIEEATPHFDFGISSDGAWLAVAFWAGARATDRDTAAIAGAAALTAANIAYYDAGGTAPHVLAWLTLGVAGGGIFGLLGHLWRSADERTRLAAALTLAGVLLVDGSDVWRPRGEADHAIELTVGILFPIVSARTGNGRAAAALTAILIAAVATTGALNPLLPDG
jgi:uncharacterized protein DUF6518